jgi:hypothetical protein
VQIAHDDTYLYIRIFTANGWSILSSKVAVAASVEELPQNKPGNPKVGHFPFKHNCGQADCKHVYEIPLEKLGLDVTGDACTDQWIAIAVHAEVMNPCKGTETAWAEGQPFPGANWAMWVPYPAQCCDEKDGGMPVDAGPDQDL